jgi:hypothetical protein
MLCISGDFCNFYSKNIRWKIYYPGLPLGGRTYFGYAGVGEHSDEILKGYPWLEKEDIEACLIYGRLTIGHERIEPLFKEWPERI